MCLRIHVKRTKKALAQKQTGYVTRYKQVIAGDVIRSIHYYFTWKPGWNISDFGIKEEDPKVVKYGIHVMISDRKYYNLKVRCYLKDLIAIGDSNDEVYKKVYVNKESLEKLGYKRKVVQARP